MMRPKHVLILGVLLALICAGIIIYYAVSFMGLMYTVDMRESPYIHTRQCPYYLGDGQVVRLHPTLFFGQFEALKKGDTFSSEQIDGLLFTRHEHTENYHQFSLDRDPSERCWSRSLHARIHVQEDGRISTVHLWDG